MNSRALAALAALIVLVVAFGGTADAARTPRQSGSVVTFTQPDIEWFPAEDDCIAGGGNPCVGYDLSGVPGIIPPPTRTHLAIRSVVLEMDVTLPSGAGLGVSGGLCEFDTFGEWQNPDVPQGPVLSGVYTTVTSGSSARTFHYASTENYPDLDDGGSLLLRSTFYCGGEILSPTEPVIIENIRWLVSSVGA